MQSINEAVSAFLARKPVAVTGMFRTPKTHGSNNVYRRLRERPCQVFEVKPNTGQVEGDRRYRAPQSPERGRGAEQDVFGRPAMSVNVPPQPPGLGRMTTLASWGQQLARVLLQESLPRRWTHVQGVAARAQSLAAVLGADADLGQLRGNHAFQA